MTERLVTSASSEPDAVAAEPAVAPIRYRQRALSVAAFVVLLGPPIGSLLISLVTAPFLIVDLAWGPTATGVGSALSSAVILAMFAAIISYLYGGLPALLSAAWLGVRTYRYGTFKYIEAMLVALVVGCVGAVVMGGVLFVQSNGIMVLSVIVIPAGIVSALVCRWLLGRFGILPASSPAIGPS